MATPWSCCVTCVKPGMVYIDCFGFGLLGLFSVELVLINMKLLVWKRRVDLWSTALYIFARPTAPGGVGGWGKASVWSVLWHRINTHRHAHRSECLSASLALVPTLCDGVHANSQAVQLTYNSFLLRLSLVWAVGSSQLHGATPPDAAPPSPFSFLSEPSANPVWLSPNIYRAPWQRSCRAEYLKTSANPSISRDPGLCFRTTAVQLSAPQKASAPN